MHCRRSATLSSPRHSVGAHEAALPAVVACLDATDERVVGAAAHVGMGGDHLLDVVHGAVSFDQRGKILALRRAAAVFLQLGLDPPSPTGVLRVDPVALASSNGSRRSRSDGSALARATSGARRRDTHRGATRCHGAEACMTMDGLFHARTAQSCRCLRINALRARSTEHTQFVPGKVASVCLQRPRMAAGSPWKVPATAQPAPAPPAPAGRRGPVRCRPAAVRSRGGRARVPSADGVLVLPEQDLRATFSSWTVGATLTVLASA